MKRNCFFLLGILFFAGANGLFPQEETLPPSAIINAAYAGDAEMVKAILAAKPDPDVRDAFGATALHEAIFEANLEVIKLLLDYGFDVNAVVPSLGYTPLHYAVWLNKPSVVPLLLRYKADKTIKNKEGQTPLEMAGRQGRRELVIALSRK
jgi:ankyrin repeat protein